MTDETTPPDRRRHTCTLDEQGARARLPQVHDLIERLRHRERDGDRLLLRFEDDDGTRALVEEFVRDESRCCSFFGFEVRRSGGEVELELSAPSEAGHLLDAAMASFDPGLADAQRLEMFHDHAAAGIVEVDG